ncbi:MAG: DUF5683 domain-containing protein [Melioribacteraceae bacterium]
MKQIFLVFIIFSTYTFSQPSWITKIPKGYLNDFFVGTASSKISKSDANQAALENAIISILRNNTITASYSEKNIMLSEEKQINDQITNEIIRKSAQELNIKGETKIIKDLKEVESYYEKNGEIIEAWVLISFPKKNPTEPPTQFSSTWRSILLPGWGQFYKEKTFKGFSFMILTLGSITSGIVFNQLSNDATNNALSSRTQARRDFFNSEAKNFNTYSTISFISAIVFYSWNIIDAAIIKNDNLFVKLETDFKTKKLVVCYRF